MRVSTITTNIRPNNDVHLLGYVGEARKYPAQGIHDDPLAVSILIETNGKYLLFVSIDVIIMPKKFADSIKNRICKYLDIEKENIIINAIHSHSAPNGYNEVGALCDYDNLEYFEYSSKKIVEDLKCLEQKLVEAKPYIGSTKVRGYYSNRTNISKPFDDEAHIIKFVHDDGIVAAMCNFNCHATVLGIQNMLVSSDLIGEVRKNVGTHLGVTPLTFTGASGDISNRQYRQGNDFDELERVGKGVSDIINTIDSYKKISIDDIENESYSYNINYDNSEHHDRYRNLIAKSKEILNDENISQDEWKLRTSEITILENKLKVDRVDFDVEGKILKMGDLTLVTFPGELATKLGMQIRNNKTTDYSLIMGYADDYKGYFIEQEEYGKCYETIATYTPKGESESLVEMIGELL